MKQFSQEARSSDPKEGVSTPIKNRNRIFHEDSLLSSSGSKRDSAFQLYCKQNLSPISYFPFISSINRTPDNHHIQTPSASQQKQYKSFFSPAIIDSSMGHTNYKHVSPIQGMTSESFEEPQKVAMEEKNVLKKSLSSKILPLVQINGGDLEKKKVIEKEQLHYENSSPVFRVSFDRKSQFDKFFDSDVKRDLNDEFTFQSDHKQSKEQSKSEVESYKRVIQFLDENEQQYQGGQTQDPVDVKSEEITQDNKQLKEKDQLHSKDSKISLQKPNVIVEDAQTQNLQGQQQSVILKLKKDRSSHSNATTAKKPAEIVSSDNALVNLKQKRKLFESPISSQNDFSTPSTQKKSIQLRSSADVDSNNKNNAGNEIPPSTSNPPAPFLSSTKKDNDQPKSQEVISFQSQESEILNEDDIDDEEEEIEKDEEMDSSKPQLFNAAPCTVHHTEERKICCNCKRTKCLKLYCECFAASRICEGCSCQGCFNKPEFEDMRQEARNAILGRNTSAFDPKIEQQNNLKQLCNEVRDINGELKAHSKGCNCKKSNCLKKYCECYQLGVKCTKLCKCDHCKNTSSSAAGVIDEEHQELHPNAEQKSTNKNQSSLNGQLADYSQLNYYYPPDQYYQYYYPGYPGGYPYYGEYYDYPEGQQLADGSVYQPPHAAAHQMKKKANKKKNVHGSNFQNKSIQEQKSKIVEENSSKEIIDPSKIKEDSEDEQKSIAVPPPLQKKIKSQEQTVELENQKQKINVVEEITQGQNEKQNQSIEVEKEREIQKDISLNSDKEILQNNSTTSQIQEEKDISINEAKNIKQVEKITQGSAEKKDEQISKKSSANKTSSNYGSPQAIPPQYIHTTRSSLRSSDGKNHKTLEIQALQKSEDLKTHEESKHALSGKKSTKSEIKEIISTGSKRNPQKKSK